MRPRIQVAHGARNTAAIVRRWRLGLRARLGLLVAAILIPLAALHVHDLLRDRQASIAKTIADAQAFVQSGVERYGDTIEDARRTLDLVAQVPTLTAGTSGECRAFLKGVEAVRPWASGFFMVGEDARIRCATVDGALGLDVGARDWYRRAVQAGNFSVSDFYVTLVRRRPVAAASLPLQPASGSTRAPVLMVNLDLLWFARLAASLGERRQVQVLLVDGGGRALARYPEVAAAGEDLSGLAAVRAALAQEAGTTEESGPDGITRLYGFRQLPGTSAHLIVAFERDAVLAPVEAAFARTAGLLSLFALALAGVIWLAGRVIFADPLQASTTRLATTVDALNQGVILVGSDGRVALSNRRAAELLSLPEALLATRPPYSVVREHQRRSLRWGVLDDDLAWSLDRERRSTYLRCERRNAAGDTLEICTVSVAGGGVLQTFADITHLKRAEEAARTAERAARESEARYRALADTLPQLVWIIHADRDETLYTNRGFEVYCGVDRSAVGSRGETLADLVHPDDAAHVARAWETARAAARICEIHGRLRRHDGAFRWHKLVLVPLCLEADDRTGYGAETARQHDTGTVTGWLCTALDIDAILSTRRALEETSTLLRIAQEAAEAGVWDLDLATGDVLFSPESARLHGLPADRPALMKLDDWIALVVPEDRAASLVRVQEAISSCRTFDVAFRLDPAASDRLAGVDCDAGRRWIQAIGRTYQDEAGTATRMIGLVFDVTARKGAEHALVEAKAAAEAARAEAEAASAAKTDFLAAMSHEIRTPLNAVIGFTDLLTGSGRLAPDLHRHAEHARTAGRALLTIVDDILDLAQVEAGRIDLEHRSFALAGLVDGCLSIVRGAAAGKVLAIEAQIDPALPPFLLGDENRLRQILLNLLNNAVKFTPRGTVRLSVDREGDSSAATGVRVAFAVSDTGIGIPKDKQHRLFQRFSQVDGSIRREFGGTGLGLAICSRLVALMGGDIGFESDDGQGSTFRFTLTLPDGAPAAQVPAARPAARSSGRLLLAEDSDLNRDLARLVLEAGGYHVDTVVDGAQAVAAVAGSSYDLVLMDVQMPGMDGMTATQAIRALPGPERIIPIIAMSANVLPDEVASFRLAGMDDHIGKPFDRLALYALIDRWLAAAPVRAAAPVAAEPALVADQGFDRSCFDALVAIVPEGGAMRLLDQFQDLLAGRFAGSIGMPEDRGFVQREAHALVSPAAMLGFSALAQVCRALDASAETEADAFAGLLLQARALSQAALSTSRTLAGGLSAGFEAQARRSA